MSKRWVTPFFESSATTTATAAGSTSTQNVRNSSKQRKTKTTRSSQRKIIDAGSRARAERQAARVGVDLLGRYEPETPEDLVVHVKKIDQVRAWIHDRIANSSSADGKYVLLHGPSGSGKSSTFRVLAKSLNVKIIEWITPIDRERQVDEDVEDRDPDFDYGGRSYRGDSLDDFLWRASRYGSILDGPQPCLKIVLVKDFPHSFVLNPQSFHDLLRKYRDYNTFPVAFICNDDAVSRRLFPDNIRSECHVHEIAFNPVNCTAVTKALKRVLELERRLNPTVVAAASNGDVPFQTFHEQSAGDLRCALLKFYFSIIKPTPTLSPVETTTSKIDDSAAAPSTVTDRHGLDLFKILGRVLYCKTELSPTAAPDDFKFVYDPDHLAKNMTDQPSLFTTFLQENYVSRFQNIKSIAAVADTFCIADAALDLSRCHKNAVSEILALSNIVRRIMVSNRRPKKTFAPFVKPKTYNSSETLAARFSRSMRCVSLNYQYSSRELVLHVMPFANVIPEWHDYRECLQQLANVEGYSLPVKRES